METKICTKCSKELPITDFYWRNKAKGVRRSDCKYCHCNWVKEKYKEKKQDIEEIKNTLTCKKCGDNRPYVLDFHHLKSKEKKEEISKLLSSNASWETIINEMEKCIILCANCHREFHYLEKEKNITIEDYLK